MISTYDSPGSNIVHVQLLLISVAVDTFVEKGLGKVQSKLNVVSTSLHDGGAFLRLDVGSRIAVARARVKVVTIVFAGLCNCVCNGGQGDCAYVGRLLVSWRGGTWGRK